MPKVLVIVPAHNEEEALPQLVLELQKYKSLFDFIIVNDASTDKTKEVIRALGIKALHLPTNLGIGGAVQSGYKYGVKHNYDYCFQIDGDGQHDPSYIEKVLNEAVTKDLDLCIGSRFVDKTLEGFKSTSLRRIGIHWFVFLNKLLHGRNIYDPTSGFRCVSKRLMKHFAIEYPADYPEPETLALALSLGLKVGEVPVVMKERQGGSSSIKTFSSIFYMVKVSLGILMGSIYGKLKQNEFQK